MLDNTSDSVKRYAPPQQRNRLPNRRKSGERFERSSYSHGSEGERNQSAQPRNFSSVDQNEKTYTRILNLEGCCSSDAARLLNDRWSAAIRSCNDQSIDLSDKLAVSATNVFVDFSVQGWKERPVMYSGASGSSWGHSKLPHQIDFLSELRSEIQKSSGSAVPTIGGRNSF